MMIMMLKKLMSLFVKVEEKLNVIYVRSTLNQLAVLLAIIKKDE